MDGECEGERGELSVSLRVSVQVSSGQILLVFYELLVPRTRIRSWDTAFPPVSEYLRSPEKRSYHREAVNVNH